MCKNNFTVGQIIILLLITFLVITCKDNNVSDPLDGQPEIPPITSFQMDFSSFPASKALAKISNPQTNENWGWAIINGVAWQTLVSVGMAIPVAAFVESFNHDPERQEDGKWLWTYEFTPQGGFKHTASLFADVSNEGVQWEMYITKSAHFENFLWYSGESDIFATEGSWTINHEPNNPTPWIGIEWSRNLEDSTGNIKYTNIISGGSENGGYIFFGTTKDPIYDTFYEIFNKGENNITSIKWNRTSHIGRVKDTKHFGNSDWHCWDESLQDVICQ